MKKKALMFLRFLFGVLFVVTSIGKLLDNRGFAAVLETYQLFPSGILLPFGLFISLSELLLGIFILWGKNLFRCALLNFGIQVAYLTLAITSNLRGLDIPNCGCFGVFLARPMTLWTIVENAVLVILAGGLWQSVVGSEHYSPSPQSS